LMSPDVAREVADLPDPGARVAAATSPRA
jgi:hypothetical protein